MKIAIIRRWDVSTIDGVNRFIFTLANGLRRLGHRIVVFSHHINDNPSNLFSINIEIRTISRTISDSNHGGYVKCMLDWLILGSRILSRFKPDMIIVNGVVPLKLRTFKVAVNHGNAIFELRESHLKRYATKMLYGTYDRVVCISGKVASEMKEVGLTCNEIIPIPLILENLCPKSESDREPIILHVGTSPRKRPDVSIRATKLLRNLGYNIKLVLVGHYEKKYNWVVIRERCSDRELRELYSKALALIHPSLWESFSYAVLEAQACGTPVIVGPGVPEEALITGKSGFKVTSFNPKEYVEKLRVLLEDSALWKCMSREARKYAENFDYVKIARQYVELYRAIL